MWNVTIAHAPLRYYRCVLWIVLITFPVFTGMVAYNLNRLETWRADTVALPAPIAFVYDSFGYWPAVLTVPAIGIACCLVFLYRIRVLHTNAKKQGCLNEPGIATA